jgi:hypothetical protein
MTVDELIARLRTVSLAGYGSYPVKHHDTDYGHTEFEPESVRVVDYSGLGMDAEDKPHVAIYSYPSKPENVEPPL